LEDLGVDGMILNRILKNRMKRPRLD
jgi:hypothetical protein